MLLAEAIILDRFKKWAKWLMSSALFWIFFIISSMMLFIVNFERPVNFVVDSVYSITR